MANRVIPKADPELGWAWRPPEEVKEALNRGARKAAEFHRRQAFQAARRSRRAA